jgi:hypothetical protein
LRTPGPPGYNRRGPSPEARGTAAPGPTEGDLALTRANRPRKRTRNENIMLVVGILVAISMVLGSFAAFFQQ